MTKTVAIKSLTASRCFVVFVLQTYSASSGLKLGQGTFTIRAVAVKPGQMDSEQVASKLIIKRRCSPPEFTTGGKGGGKGSKEKASVKTAGVVHAGDMVVLSSRTWDVLPDAKIHYTIERCVHQVEPRRRQSRENFVAGMHFSLQFIMSLSFFNSTLLTSSTTEVFASPVQVKIEAQF